MTGRRTDGTVVIGAFRKLAGALCLALLALFLVTWVADHAYAQFSRDRDSSSSRTRDRSSSADDDDDDFEDDDDSDRRRRLEEALLLGDPISAQVAADLGLINRVLPDEELDAHVDNVIERLLALPPHSLNYTKVSLNLALKQMTGTAFEASVAYQAYTLKTADGRAGTFWVEHAYPHRIIRWELAPDLGAELTGTSRLDYWKLHRNGDESYLKPLGLKPTNE